MTRSIRRLLVAGLVAAVTSLTTPVYATSIANQVAYRQNLMKALGGTMGTIFDIVAGKVPYKNVLVDNALALHALTLHIEEAFPKGSLNKKSNAKPAIWQKWSEFKEHAHKIRTASAALLAAARKGDRDEIVARFKEAGHACGGCHKEFRVKRD